MGICRRELKGERVAVSPTVPRRRVRPWRCGREEEASHGCYFSPSLAEGWCWQSAEGVELCKPPKGRFRWVEAGSQLGGKGVREAILVLSPSATLPANPAGPW